MSIDTSQDSPPLKNFKFPDARMKRKQQEGDNDDDDVDENSCDYYFVPTIAPVISLKQGLQRKATPYALASWVKLALTLDGRDKITKVCQYSARMLAWWYMGSHQAKRFQSMQASLNTSRKAFRLGRSLIEVQKIRESGFLDLLFNESATKKSDPAWKIVGSALKMIGLMGFWAGDNVNFLAGGGLFDDFRQDVTQKDRMARRGEIKTKAALFANRFYFFGGVAGLVTSLRSYLTHRQTSVREAHSRLMDSSKAVAQNGDDKNKEAWKEAKAAWDKAREEQFSLFVALLKVRTA